MNAALPFSCVHLIITAQDSHLWPWPKIRCGLSKMMGSVQDYVARDEESKLPVLAVSEEVYAALEASAAKQGKTVAHMASEALRGVLL